MNYIKLKAHAKINLSLDVTGTEGGYHLIDSVVTTIDLSDVIAVKKRRDKLVSVTMHGMGSENISFGENNAVRAAEALVRQYGTNGADITVWKNIPLGAGLGGSSADVAGVLNAMKTLYGADEEGVKDIADSLGSDCGYMIYGGYARMRGRGERVQLLDGGPKLDVGIIFSRGGVSTAACYSLFDSVGSPSSSSDKVLGAVLRGDKAELGRALHNGLYAPAKALNGDIERAYAELAAFDPLGVCMSGSGSAVYAIFENDQFLQYARSRYCGRFSFISAKTYLPRREEDRWQKKD